MEIMGDDLVTKEDFLLCSSNINSAHMVSIAVVNSCRVINQTNLNENKHTRLFMIASQSFKFVNQVKKLTTGTSDGLNN